MGNGVSFFVAIKDCVCPDSIFWYIISYGVTITPIGTLHGGFTMFKICSHWISLNAVGQGSINDVYVYV